MELYQQIFFTTLAVSFAILHLIIYLYNPRFKPNLFFSIFLFLYALNIFFDYQAALASTWQEAHLFLRIHRGVVVFNPIFALLFTYYVFSVEIPKYFWLIAASLISTGFFAVLDPINNYNYVQIPAVIATIEVIRVFTKALINNLYQAWIIVIGYSLLFLFSTYDLLMDLGLISPVAGIVNAYPFGFVGLIVFASIYLAKDFASRNQIILEQEREAKKMEINQKLLEAEDKRKAKELNDARVLQLSLLPDCQTNIGNYEFCFDMQTASEVGGDYYDYKVSENGNIYLVIGDATDHGMKAGMMVSIIKSLFLSQIDKSEIVNFFNTCSRTIKQMKLKNLYMALMVIKLENNTLTFSSAGIPPLFIHRKKTNLLEEFKLKGMPLGAIEFFPYETSQVELEEGDTVLAMTDGLPELFNMHKQSFDLDNIKEIFLESANESVNNIVGNLISAGKKWLNGTKQNDDITIVAFRLKQ